MLKKQSKNGIIYYELEETKGGLNDRECQDEGHTLETTGAGKVQGWDLINGETVETEPKKKRMTKWNRKRLQVILQNSGRAERRRNYQDEGQRGRRWALPKKEEWRGKQSRKCQERRQRLPR